MELLAEARGKEETPAVSLSCKRTRLNYQESVQLDQPLPPLLS